jgi:hypothetical protein
MSVLRMFDKVRIKKNGIVGTVIDISDNPNTKKIYTVEDDNWDLYYDPLDSFDSYWEEELEFIAHGD